ncbi:iron permease FTR1 family-domain-containing protein [Obelidium mucronatum]|nr:iron permease FTR1 family-domain-containing protein [Obelidium mucronatum]
MLGFSLPVFFVIFRECTEAAIVVSVLLAFVSSRFKEDAVMRRTLVFAMWAGVGGGLLLSLATGAVFLVLWFKYASNLWSSAEALWEAILQLVACILMTIMAFAFLKSDELTAKWHRKLHKSLKDRNLLAEPLETRSGSTLASNNCNNNAAADNTSEIILSDISPKRASQIDPNSLLPQQSKNDNTNIDERALRRQRWKGAQAFFWIPFITVVREGLEGMLFLGGTAISEDPGHIPLAVLGGLAGGLIIGYAIYRAGNTMKLQTFFVSATIFIFYLSAGLMAKSVWAFERNTWNVHLGVGDSDSSIYYNVQTSVWHTNCCNPEDPSNGGWQLLNAIVGWTNSATVGTVTAYILYWLFVSGVLISMKLMDRRRKRLGREKVGFKKMINSFFVRA